MHPVVVLLNRARDAGVIVELIDGNVDVTHSNAPTAKLWTNKFKPYKSDVLRLLTEGTLEDPPREEPRDRYKPFPVHVLPSPLDALVEEAAVAIGCDEAFVALPLLSTVAASIGNTCRLVVKKGWNVPPAMWTMIVGESGTAKSPAFKIAKAPLQRHQKGMLEEYGRQMEIYKQEVEQYKWLCKELKKSKPPELPPDPPAKPTLQRVIVSDTTVEALAPILSQNPRGLLLQRDELNGWLGSFNQYKSAKGADESAWLSMFDGESITVDRKGEGTVPTYVESALVSITGGIQPAILAASMTKEHRMSGMASRFLIASPPRRCQTWTDEEVSEETMLMIDSLFIKLLDIDFADIETTTPHFVGLSSESKQVFREFFNEHHQEQTDLTGDSAAAWSKLLGYVPRIALVFHIVKQLSHGGEITTPVDSRTVDQSIELVTWFKQEAARLYASIDDTDDQRELRELAAWIDRKHGGECTPSDLVRGIKSIKTVAEAEEEAKLLVRAGLAAWSLVETPSGTGPQKRVLRTV